MGLTNIDGHVIECRLFKKPGFSMRVDDVQGDACWTLPRTTR